MFSVQSLSKDYRSGSGAVVRALVDVSVTIDRGSLTAVTGPSGSGKTTLLALLGALERPTRGSIRFADRELGECSDAELARIRRRIGFVFQDYALIPTLSAAENITYPLIPRGIPRADRLRRAGNLLDRFGLSDKLTSPIRELSGGEQQRVAIARALAGNPEVLIADEPASSLDAETCRVLLTVMRELHAAGQTVVFSSHDPQLLALATRIIKLARGHLEEDS